MSLTNDLRYGIRSLIKSPGYASVAVLTLALAIGANTVIFSFANVLLLQPLPLADPEGLAFVYSVDPHSSPRGRVSFADYRDFSDRSRSFSSLAAWTDDNVTLTGHGEPQRLQARRVTPNLFTAWGLTPIAGRLLHEGEDVPGGACTVVLSDHLWGALFQRNPSVVSTSMAIDGQACTIVGVITPAIEIGNMSLIDVWMPHRAEAPRERRDARSYAVSGRLNAGVTVEQAGAEITTIAEQLQREHPDTNTAWTTRMLPTKEAMIGENGWLVFGLLMLVVAFVLLIACANVANLMLARATRRRREMAVRVALGATRWAVVRQLITESLCIGISGGLIGVAIAEAGLRVIRAASYEPFFKMVVIDRYVLGFAVVLSILTPVLFSVLPSIHAASEAFGSGLREGGRSGSTAGTRRSRNALVVAQISLAMILLIMAGLIVRSLIAIRRIDLGFDPRAVLTAQVELPSWKFKTGEEMARFYERVEDRLARIPGATAAGAATGLPALAAGSRVPFDLAEHPAATAAERPWAQRFTATQGYLQATGIALLRGRWFSRADSRETAPVVVINAEAARRYFQTVDRAIGSRILLPDRGPDRSAEIIGVVGVVANPDLEMAPAPYIYDLAAQQPPRTASLVVRAARPSDLAGQLRAAVHDVDADVPVFDVRTLQTALDDEMSSNRVLMSMFVAFAMLALVLATAGVYAVISFLVGQRTQEIGVRVALGAVPSDIRRLIFGQGLGLVAIGSVIGVGGAAALARTLASALFGVTPFDPATYGSVIGVVLLAALGAMWAPAQRAISLDPVRSLKAE
jgi:predicted permease